MDLEERQQLIETFLGKRVDIVIDRPVGYVHVSKGYSITYPVNYGYIPGICGGDGEDMDVYLLGIKEPVTNYSAKIIGAVRRLDDVEDKLVAAPEGMHFHQAEIAQQTYFQEQYFKTNIEAIYQKSCGAVIYRRLNNKTEYLCVKQKRSGTFSVPKGHMEAFETERQTALREIKEETGISTGLKPDFRMEIQYNLQNNKHKTVVLFLAEYCGEIEIDNDEITKSQWLGYGQAKAVLPKFYEKVINSAESYVMGETKWLL
jgi:inorganic pyrophosphatase